MDAYFENERLEMRDLLPKGKSIRSLEVGCGSGRFSVILNASERWGIEPNSSAAAEASARGLKVLIGLYADVKQDLPDGHFDLIIANDVIEHMPDHEAFLRAIQQKLAPGGRLVLSVPNVRHISLLMRLFLMKDWRYQADGVLDRTHLRFFTKKSLLRSLVDCGYEVESILGLRSTFRIDPGISRAKTALNWLVTASILLLTLGHSWDTQYLQYGLRAKVSS